MDFQAKLKFLSLYRMVLADGVVQPEEILTLKTIGRTHYGLTDEAIDKLLVEDIAELPIIETSLDKIALLYEMALIAWSDDDLDESERTLLINYAEHFNISEDVRSKVVDFLLDCAHKKMAIEMVIQNFK